MKKVKIMLMSIAVLAIVGALAFKAKYDHTFCYGYTTIYQGAPTCTDTNSGINLLCDTIAYARITDEANGVIACTADTDPVSGGCPDGCGNLTFTMIDQ